MKEVSDLIMLLNAQGITPSARSVQRWKNDYIKGLIETNLNKKYIFIALTETWLKSFMSDSQISINDYNVYRADRKKRERGDVNKK